MSTADHSRRHPRGQGPAPTMTPGRLVGILVAPQVVLFGVLQLYASLGAALLYVAICAAVDLTAVRITRQRWERSRR